MMKQGCDDEASCDDDDGGKQNKNDLSRESVISMQILLMPMPMPMQILDADADADADAALHCIALIQFNSIQFNSIQFNSIQFNPERHGNLPLHLRCTYCI
jgi:hypothetical protein